MKSVCSNKWCKSHFEHDELFKDTVCPKCRSFEFELSSGVTWSEKKYEGSRFDNLPHAIDIKVNRYFK
jgi:hypothetical protein